MNDDREQQNEFKFGCRLGPPPWNQSGQPLLSEIVGPNGLAVQGEEYCAYVTTNPESGRELVIQHKTSRTLTSGCAKTLAPTKPCASGRRCCRQSLHPLNQTLKRNHD